MADNNQFALLGSRRFLPFFCTQFLGAFNDNVFKSALMVIIAFRLAADQANTLNNLAAGLFILPFFLFSATAGQLADKYDKALLIRRIKLAEIGISLFGVVALVSGSNALCLTVLFLLGVQSAFFGPIKYAILPQHLHKAELVGGNALVEMATFVAILGGTIVGTILSGASDTDSNIFWIGGLIIAIAVIGYLVCRAIPVAAPPVPDLKIELNPFRQTARVLKEVSKSPAIFYAIVGISWFWLLGVAYLTQIPSFAKNVLGGNEPIVALLLCSFTIGVAIGSLLCGRLSGGRVELGLVPIGAAGLTYAGIALSVIGGNLAPLADVSLTAFWGSPGAHAFLFHLVLIGIFGGLYIVPLYAMIQERSAEAIRARVIAMTNIMNSLFMVISALLGIIFLSLLSFTIPQFFMVIALMNAAVAVFVFTKVPEFAMRLMIWLLSHTMYRVK
ncbi:MFS transporter, partial [Microbulbifer sp.]|uniref:MFS transporter n=1 Tax=Microbulbifer sp. TaxID=1908541 RepID=UPI002F93C5C7